LISIVSDLLLINTTFFYTDHDNEEAPKVQLGTIELSTTPYTMSGNSSNGSNVRKAKTVIQNPYAKKRPRPNPPPPLTSNDQQGNFNNTRITGHPLPVTTSSAQPQPSRIVSNTQNQESRGHYRPPTAVERSSIHSIDASSRMSNGEPTTGATTFPTNHQNSRPVVMATATSCQENSYNPSVHQSASNNTSQSSNPNYVEKSATSSSPVIDLSQDQSTTKPQYTIHKNPQIYSHNQKEQQQQQQSFRSHTTNVATKKPPPVPTTTQITVNNMASLRPASWSNKNASSTSAASSSAAMGHQNTNNSGTSKDNSYRKEAPAAPTLSQQFLTQDGKMVSSPASHKHPLISQLPIQMQFHPNKLLPVEDDRRRDLIRHAKLSQPLANGWTLFDHQKRAILSALKMRRFILALDMGLGKTLIGCVWARSFQKTYENCQVIVICPVSLKQEWTRTAVEATELQVESEETKKPKKAKKAKTKKGKETSDNDDVIDNGDCAGDGDGEETKENIGPKVQIYSWAKVPKVAVGAQNPYVVVCDEAHAIQSMQSSRTKELLALIKPKQCVGVLLLSGTPMKNGKPSNLFPLLRAVGHPLGGHQRLYETQFCAGREKQFGRGPAVWDASGSSNLPMLQKLIDTHLLHLKKDDVLKSLPPRTRKFEHVPVSHRMEMSHRQALQDLSKQFEMANSRDGDSSTVLLRASEKLRFVSAVGKVDATVSIAKRVLQDEPAVVIFTTFVQVAKDVHAKLASAGWEGEILTGETPPVKRQPMVDKFQKGLSPVFVCTFGAGGVGLTLTAARTVILLDRPWTPGDAHQAEDRVRRIGQKFAVTSIWVTAFEVDKQIDTMLESKSQTSNAVLEKGNSQSNALGGGPQKISIFQLLKTILPSAQSNPCISSAQPRDFR